MLTGLKTYATAIVGVLTALAALFELIAPGVAVYILAIEGFLAAMFLRAGITTETDSR